MTVRLNLSDLRWEEHFRFMAKWWLRRVPTPQEARVYTACGKIHRRLFCVWQSVCCLWWGIVGP